MKASLYHVQLNVANRSFSFYRALFEALEYRVIADDGEVLGARDDHSAIWLAATTAAHRTPSFHRRRTGLNHLAFRVGAREDVDRFAAEFLRPREISPLYGGPRDYPEYAPGYYAVFFEDPERIKLEVAHVPAP